MKKIIFSSTILLTMVLGCKKSDTTPIDFNTAKNAAITDFVNKVAIAGYAELKTKAATLNRAINTLNSTSTDANLTAARDAWKDMRSTWEKCEGFLFGPVADDEHDPETDTWPVNFNDLNALLADMSHPLDVADIESLSNRALKGYHPTEYILWGVGGANTASSITARQKLYVASLSTALKNQADQLYHSWSVSGGNYADVLLKAGNGSNIFPLKKDAFLALLGGVLDICSEVADTKIAEPFNAAAIDPAAGAQLVESPFSGNSTTDFRNNIIGAYNVYLGKFNEDGTGISDLVRLKNISLDNSIQQKFNASIGSFNSITVPFESAIVTQRTQCQQVMTSIHDLATLLDTDLRNFIITNITD